MMTAHEHFHLLQLRGAIVLEGKGMRHSSGRSATQFAREKLGLKRSVKRDEVLAAIEDKLEEAGTKRRYTKRGDDASCNEG